MAQMSKDQAERHLLQVLAEFRHQLRSFLQFSERAAHRANLHPQQHQLLLQVAGAPQGAVASIAYAAWRLGLRHNSTVELVDRSVAQGLLDRTSLEITVKGRRILKKLSQNHARELRELGPFLIRSLRRIERADRARTRQRAR